MALATAGWTCPPYSVADAERLAQDLGVSLPALGADPSWHIPARDDGYGVSTATVERLAAAGTRLILTADCAITSVEEVARARELGVDVVVSDHHRPGERLPDCPIVHPAVC